MTDISFIFSESNQFGKFSLWKEHKRIIAQKSVETLRGETADEEIQPQSEISGYLRLPIEALECNPIDWWQRHSIMYPNIAPFALKLLCILATSVPSERLFSKAGETMTQKRNHLQGKRLSKLLLLQSIDKKYWNLN